MPTAETFTGLVRELFANRLSKADATPHAVTIKKQVDEQQLVFGEVYAPGFPDSQGDFMTADEIQGMAYRFMKRGQLAKIDVQHNRSASGSYIVESFIARDGDPIYIPGSWVIGVHIPDQAVWGLVKSGEINGFSLDGAGYQIPTTFEIDIPNEIIGRTSLVDGHDHGFVVRFADDGKFLGGYTTKADDGHSHDILGGTLTEKTNNHNHTFSFLEGVLNLGQVAN